MLAELIGDAGFALAPLTDVDARGARPRRQGRAARRRLPRRTPRRRAALVDLVHRLGRLADELPEVAELDLNPVIARADGCVAVDARIRVAGSCPRATDRVERLVTDVSMGSTSTRLRRRRRVEAPARRPAPDGGYEIVHDSPGLEIGVYVLVAPEPDRQQPHVDDEVYVVLEGSGALDDRRRAGRAARRSAPSSCRPAQSIGFVGYEHLAMLVIFEQSRSAR